VPYGRGLLDEFSPENALRQADQGEEVIVELGAGPPKLGIGI